MEIKIVDSDDLVNAASFFVKGEPVGAVDVASGQEMRRWPSLDEAARRFNFTTDEIRRRSVLDGWEGRRAIFQADLARARQKGIAERIAEQEMPARMAYLGIHNDVVRGVGTLLQQMVPRDGPPACLVRDLREVLTTTCKAAELMAHATGKARESQGAFSLAVQIAQAHAMGVPVPTLPPGMQALGFTPEDGSGHPAASMNASLWSILVEARKLSNQPPATPGQRDEWDEPSPLPPHLATDQEAP